MLTDDEKGRIRHHLGYGETNAVTTFSVGGVAQPFEATWIIEAQMNKVRPEAEPRVRKFLDQLDAYEDNMDSAMTNVEAVKVGSIEINLNVLRDMEMFYLRVRGSLATLLQVQANPYDRRYGSGFSVPVA